VTAVPDVPHDPRTTREWTDHGTALFLSALARTDDDTLHGPSSLPGWTGRHLVAHVSANAGALLNLTRWAATGVKTPMYAGPEQRDADIRAGACRPPAELRAWARASAGQLSAALDALTEPDWSRRVRTAQGRDVPATAIPWLRAREVLVHAVDLDPALGFDALPGAFLVALVEDIVQRRSTSSPTALELHTGDGAHAWTVPGPGPATEVHGALADIATYLAGRPGSAVTSPVGTVPDLPPWL
jgi:maleylpyruvate isomerase